MHNDSINQILDNLSPALVEEAAYVQYSRRRFPWGAAAAACLCLLLFALPVFRYTGILGEAAFEAPFVDLHFTDQYANSYITGSIAHRFRLSEFSQAFQDQLTGGTEQFEAQYFDSLADVQAHWGIPLLKYTSPPGFYGSYHAVDSLDSGAFYTGFSRDKQGNPVCIFMSSHKNVYYTTEYQERITIEIQEEQKLLTEYYRHSDILEGYLQSNETLIGTDTYTTASGTSVCLLHFRSMEDPKFMYQTETWSAIFQQDGLIVTLDVTIDATEPITPSEFKSFVLDLLDSYVLISG